MSEDIEAAARELRAAATGTDKEIWQAVAKKAKELFGVSPEQQRVLDKAVKCVDWWRAEGLATSLGPRELTESVDALRLSQAPKPRYTLLHATGDSWAKVLDNQPEKIGANIGSGSQEITFGLPIPEAERIAAMLNWAEQANRPQRPES